MVNNYISKSQNPFLLVLPVHRLLPVRLVLLRQVVLSEFYFFAVNEVPCLQKEEDHTAQELTGGGDAMPLHEGGDTVRTDGVRADTH